MYTFPMWKILLLMAVLLIGSGIIATFDTSLHPTISANVAVGQLEDAESGAIVMRAYDRIQNFVPVIAFGSFVFFGLFLLWADIMRAARNYSRST